MIEPNANGVIRLWEEIDAGVGKNKERGVYAIDIEKLGIIKRLLAKLFCSKVTIDNHVYAISKKSFKAFIDRNIDSNENAIFRNRLSDLRGPFTPFKAYREILDDYSKAVVVPRAREICKGLLKGADSYIESLHKKAKPKIESLTKKEVLEWVLTVGLGFSKSITEKISNSIDENEKLDGQLQRLLKPYIDNFPYAPVPQTKPTPENRRQLMAFSKVQLIDPNDPLKLFGDWVKNAK